MNCKYCFLFYSYVRANHPDGSYICYDCRNSQQESLNMYFNGNDWVIASNKKEALRLWCEAMGEKKEDYEKEMEWEVLNESKILNIWCDAQGTPSGDNDNAYKISGSVSFWIEKLGKGYVGSLDF